MRRTQRDAGRDTGEIITGWLTRLFLVVAVLGLAGFDAISLGVTRFSVAADAEEAAIAGRDSYALTHQVQKAYEAAQASMAESNPANVIPAATFLVSQDGTVTLVMERDAVTIVVVHVPRLRDHTVMKATAVAAPAAP